MQEKLGGGHKRGPMEVRVWLRMLTCVHTIEKRLRRNFSDQFETTLPRFDVMAALDRRPEGQSMGQLSRALLVSNGNVTAIVKNLQEDGLVVSQADPQDRRSAIVSLSEKGRERFRKLSRAHHAWIKESFAEFPKDKQAELYEMLAALKTSIAAEGTSSEESHRDFEDIAKNPA